MNNYKKIKALAEQIRQQTKEESILKNLDQIIELATEEPEEEKKLYAELGIENDKDKKKVVQELKRLGELKGTEVGEGLIKEILDKKDNLGNFCPELVFWNLAWQLNLLSGIGGEQSLSAFDKDEKNTKNPSFWTNFDKELEWVKQNVSEEYFSELENLTVPSLFPTDKLEISEILVVNELEGDENSEKKTFKTNSQIVDKAWQIIKEKATELNIRAIIHYISPNYTIMINYDPDNPNRAELEKLMTETPLRLELEQLKEKQSKLPTNENFEKLKNQVKFLQSYLEGNLDEESYQKISEEINKIK